MRSNVRLSTSSLLCHAAYEIVLGGGFLHGCHRGASARQKFKRHGSGAGEEVERRGRVVEVDKIFNDVEYVLAGEVGGGTRCDVGGDVETSTAIFSSYYSHNGKIIRSNGDFMASEPARNIADGNIMGIT